MKKQTELNEAMIRQMVENYLLENNMEEGLGGKIVGGAVGAIAGKALMGKLCDILGIKENGILGKVMCSRIVSAGIGAEVGDLVGDKIALATGGMKALHENSERIGWSDDDPRMQLIDMIDEGLVDPIEIAKSLIEWISVDDAKRFMQIYQLNKDDEDDEDDEFDDNLNRWQNRMSDIEDDSYHG